MPVLGHAFVGLAIGVSTKPSARGRPEPPVIAAASALWLLAVVSLAYLPDIVAQPGLIAGWSDSRLFGHSVMFAVAVSPAIAAVLMRLARVSFPHAFVTALVSLLVRRCSRRSRRAAPCRAGRPSRSPSRGAGLYLPPSCSGMVAAGPPRS